MKRFLTLIVVIIVFGSALAEIPSDYVASWRFENNVLDDTGVNNGTRFGGTFVSGKIGQALRLERAQQDYLVYAPYL